MCNIWKHPTLPVQEIGLSTLNKLPDGFDNVNITGGEPTLRNDLLDMCEILYPKAKKLEISTNGLRPEKLETVIQRFPNIKIRISLEGFQQTNDRIRGERKGFETKMRAMARLKELGGTDLGFASVIQDENIDEIIELYNLTKHEKIEFATSALHNAFQFHKGDNWPYNRLRVARQIETLITEMLRTNSVKSWFRAYLNLGLIRKILGQKRLLVCTAGTEFIFVDPWSDVYACNVRPDLLIGNLEEQPWDRILSGDKARRVREQVAACAQNCWMVTTARTAMRNPRVPSLPKLRPLAWVINNKLRVTMGMPIRFQKYINYVDIANDSTLKRKDYSSGDPIRRKLSPKSAQPYDEYGPFNNR
jgi:sulfatase maturation enzyme AslB (radical SAM superfamily)